MPVAAPGSLVRTLGASARRLYDWVISWAARPRAQAALVVLSFAEASFFPVPPDVLLIAMAVATPKRAFRFAALCSVASVFGGLAGYAIGALAWHIVAPWFYAYVPGFTPASFEHIRAWYQEWGVALVFTAGFSPIPYKLFTIASGVMGMALWPFTLASAVSRSARFFLVAGLIYRYGEPIRAFIDRYFNALALAFTALLIGGFVVLRWVG
ncbi:MAG: YqaA family protein [Myxococcota bacterium]